MEQQIGYCATSHGATIAYATIGDGPPLVSVTGWPGHLAAEWEKSVSRQFLEALAEGSDLFGTAVQLARCICDKAEPGQISASNVVRELAVGKGCLFSDIGESELRGFEDQVRLFDVSWQQE